jgi:hypothetical protein
MCLLKNPEHPVTGSFVEGSKHPNRLSFFSFFNTIIVSTIRQITF